MDTINSCRVLTYTLGFIQSQLGISFTLSLFVLKIMKIKACLHQLKCSAQTPVWFSHAACLFSQMCKNWQAGWMKLQIHFVIVGGSYRISRNNSVNPEHKVLHNFSDTFLSQRRKEVKKYLSNRWFLCTQHQIQEYRNESQFWIFPLLFTNT